MLRRRLVSAGLAAFLFASAVVLLTLLLNPSVSVRREIVPLLLALFLPYWAISTLALLVLAALLALVRFWPAGMRTPIEGLPSFTSFLLLALAVASFLYFRSLDGYRDSIPAESVRALRSTATVYGCFAVVIAAVGFDTLLRPMRRRGGQAALVVLAAAAVPIVPLALWPEPHVPEAPVALRTEPVRAKHRVILVGIDGLSADFVREGAQRGRLPAFARLLRRGAHGPLTTLVPTEGPPVWTSILTGRLPRDHGVKSFSSYRLLGRGTPYELLPKDAGVSALERAGLVTTIPVTASSRRNRALWDALNAFGIQTGVVRLFGTHPAGHVSGFMLSNYFHVLRQDPARAASVLYPPDLRGEITARALRGAEIDRSLVARLLEMPTSPRPRDGRLRGELLERALAPDLTYWRAGSVLRAAYDPPFFATYFYGLDVVGHAFMRFARPEEFGNVAEDDVRVYGPVLDRYAAMLGEWVSELAQQLQKGDVLVVVSGYGLRPVPAWRNAISVLTSSGNDASGEHMSGASGFFLMVGDGVRAGAVPERASVLDIAPTLLYLMGLPVARDMEGRVLSELFEEDLVRGQPLTFIPSYESLAVTKSAAPDDLSLPPLPDEG